jgi:hypothetical protein
VENATLLYHSWRKKVKSHAVFAGSNVYLEQKNLNSKQPNNHPNIFRNTSKMT